MPSSVVLLHRYPVWTAEDMGGFKLWKSDITFTICLGTSTLQINPISYMVEQQIDILGISAVVVTLVIFASLRGFAHLL